MPLTWDATKCNIDFEDECENVKTQTIVLMMPAMGMRNITESNWREVYIRCSILHKIHGTFMHLDGKPYKMTPEDIWRRISLHTNSSPETIPQWRKKIMENLASDARWDLRDADRNA